MATTTTVRTHGSGIDTTDFKSVVKALRKAEPELNKQLRRQLRAAGTIVADEARALAEQSSKSIPPTVKVRSAGASVAVIAGGKDVPVALLFEVGNAGSKKSVGVRTGQTKFRHPVFGNRNVWVDQDMHPFLAPAAVANAGRVDAAIGRALDDITRIIVLEG